MRSSKTAGPSCIAVEMLKASGDNGIDLVTELANSIVNEYVVWFLPTGMSVIL